MAPIQAPVLLSHLEGVSGRARSRELYKYYQPTAPINNSNNTVPGPSSPNPEQTDPLNSAPDFNVASNVTSSKISSPDTGLTAFCQLVAWRTGADRAMISLIDAETQYFIAESTKTVDLIDNTKHVPGDEIWMGCTSVSKAGRLCERTIEVKPTTTGDYPAFIVNDLTKDERFKDLPFVTGPPFLKFYAGVPLITKRGIPIGSLFIVNSRTQNGLSKDNIHFMGTMATTTMRHIEMVREVEEHRKGMKMSRGLASFVEGRSEFVEADLDAGEGEGTRIVGQFEESGIATTRSKSGSTRGSAHSASDTLTSAERKEREVSVIFGKTEGGALSSDTLPEAPDTHPPLNSGSRLDSDSRIDSFEGTISGSPSNAHPLLEPASPDEDQSEASSMKILFSRAANLIREAFEVDGGVVFYDAQRGLGVNDLRQRKSGQKSHKLAPLPDDSHTSGDDGQPLADSASEHDGDSIPNSNSPAASSPASAGLGEGVFSRSSAKSGKKVEIMGFSTRDAASIHGDEYPGPQSFIPFEESTLNTLLRRYPRGKLWIFDTDGLVSSSSEEDAGKSRKNFHQPAQEVHHRKVRMSREKSDAKYLLRRFPGVRQLLFVPLWDAGRSRWLSGCCAWSIEPTRVFSKQNELAFLSAFGNSVMAECSRIDTEIADQKKGDFIGSVSHELRSPLHGILASAEFLGDEVQTSFEKGLVETIDSCGRTLLDTINHILDFSKINHFEKNWRRSKRSARSIAPHTSDRGLSGQRNSELPMINLFAEIDVSVVCEEVVEGVFAGHVFQNITAPSFDMVPDSRGKMSDPRKQHGLSHETVDSEPLQNSDVAVILDIDIQNYYFTTQPGAFRRVIMNLLGNALKYTSHGYVRIMLEARDIEDHTPGTGETIPRSMVTLTISDTGRGIASEFLRSKLFTPFAQENSLSSGTGLGLSMVRSIVALLEGEINIDSELGRGTQVKVTLPLLREMPKTADSSSTSKSITSYTRDVDESISLLRARVLNKRVSLYGFDKGGKDPIIYKTGQLLKASITNFLTNWYGLKVVPYGQPASFIVVDEETPTTLNKIINQAPTSDRRLPSILVLCSHTSRFDRQASQNNSKGRIGFVAKPIGPLKLARALQQCLDGAAPPIPTPGLLGPSRHSSGSEESNDLSAVFEELSLSPHGGEMLDNSRMAAGSDNARKAIESPTPNATTERTLEFPFPVDAEENASSSVGGSASNTSREKGHGAVGESETLSMNDCGKKKKENEKTELERAKVATPSTTLPLSSGKASTYSPLGLVSSNASSNPSPRTAQRSLGQPQLPSTKSSLSLVSLSEDTATSLPAQEKAPATTLAALPTPSLLLVDDNKINLSLLRTYMRKRHYTVVDEAENGLEAVRKVEERVRAGEGGYDIIFMDISMPVLDGFGATRQIRGIEKTQSSKAEEAAHSKGGKAEEGSVAPALIIALTGLASSRDQSEAFTSGFDLFLTKPVSFKEVGKMLDNWEANRERDIRGSGEEA